MTSTTSKLTAKHDASLVMSNAPRTGITLYDDLGPGAGAFSPLA